MSEPRLTIISILVVKVAAGQLEIGQLILVEGRSCSANHQVICTFKASRLSQILLLTENALSGDWCVVFGATRTSHR